MTRCENNIGKWYHWQEEKTLDWSVNNIRSNWYQAALYEIFKFLRASNIQRKRKITKPVPKFSERALFT